MDNLVKPHGKEGKLKPPPPRGRGAGRRAKEGRIAHEGHHHVPGDGRCHHDGNRRLHAAQGASWGPPIGRGVCTKMQMADGTFWPIPVTVSADKDVADGISDGQEVALVDEETGTTMATMKVTEKYTIDKGIGGARRFFRTTDTDHPGVAVVMAQKAVNLAGADQGPERELLPRGLQGRLHAARRSRASSSTTMGWRTRGRASAPQSHAPLA